MTASPIATPMSAATFLFGDEPAAALAERLDATDALRAARDGATAVGDDVWAAASGQVSSIAADFCALDLASVLVAVWQKHDALVEAADSTRDTSDTVVLPLGSRRASLAQHPSIDVTMGRVSVAVIRFELSVVVDVVGIAGVVRGGALVAVRGGVCDVTASFGAGGVTLAERTAEFDPALTLPLGSGIVLPPRQRAGRLRHRAPGAATAQRP